MMSSTTIKQYSEIPFEVFTINGLYSETEMNEWKAFTSQRESDRPFTSNVDFKNGKVNHVDFSSRMFQKIQTILPNTYTDRQGTTWSFVGACKYIMYAKISHQQSFMIHTDTGCEYDEATNEYSKFTVLTYLNDDFDGGNTIFYDDNFHETFRVIPSQGMTLLFDINLFHAGEKVLYGFKNWIGTELVCKKLTSSTLERERSDS